MSKKIFYLLGISAFVFFVVNPNFSAQAINVQDQINSQLGAAANGAQVGQAVDPRLVAASIIQVVLSLLGTVFFILLVMSGYWLITARGDESRVEKAQSTIRSAIIGLAIVLMAYGITLFVTSRVFVATNPVPPSANSNPSCASELTVSNCIVPAYHSVANWFSNLF